jgi:nondiscriminating aspartyl-tRNA synthetase
MKRILTSDIKQMIGKEVHLRGYVDAIRRLGGITFVVLRDRKGTTQIVSDTSGVDLSKLTRYDIVYLDGFVREESRAPGGYEVVAKSVTVISSPKEPYPLSVMPKSQERLETLLEYRPISLRNPKIRDIFIFQQSLAQAFRNYLLSQDFTEIFTPKIVPQVAESGAELFPVKYFENDAFLTQSPQFYKQMMVGSGLERVFEIGHVYRAEEHSTTRHLNEYVSMDLETGFIDSFQDLMDLEESMLKYMFGEVCSKHKDILERFNVKAPQFDSIPRVPLLEMKARLQKEYKKRFEEGKDIDPEGEKLATRYVQEHNGSDIVFLTHYPKKNRPFYAMPNRENPELTDSFDLIFRGIEITTGGQRIHDYDQLLSNMIAAGVNPEKCAGYLMAFKYGMPPHGGMGIGLERLTMTLLGLQNVREASLFPRDRTRYSP